MRHALSFMSQARRGHEADPIQDLKRSKRPGVSSKEFVLPPDSIREPNQLPTIIGANGLGGSVLRL